MPKRLVIVDDDPSVARMLTLLFEQARYRVRCAGDLAGARRVLDLPAPVDAVILDRGLPDGDGLTLCRAIKAARPALPVVILTAEAEARALAGSCGADAFVTKPFEPDDLLALVERCLRAPRRRSALGGDI